MSPMVVRNLTKQRSIMKTKEQIEARIEQLRGEQNEAGEQLHLAESPAKKALIRNEMYARNNQILAHLWDLED